MYVIFQQKMIFCFYSILQNHNMTKFKKQFEQDGVLVEINLKKQHMRTWLFDYHIQLLYLLFFCTQKPTN